VRWRDQDHHRTIRNAPDAEDVISKELIELKAPVERAILVDQ
jgi:hypothetical protein